MYLIIILFFAMPSFLYSQHVSNWQNHTDMKNVKSIMINGSLIWAASDGGGFSYNIDNNSYKKYSKIDGLNGVLISAVTVDKYGKVWFGSSNGIIDVYNPDTNSFESILAIFNNHDKNSKVINELVAIGDTIFVSSDFGISLINASNLLFIDTFSKFGELPSNIGVNSIFNPGLIYACTDMGVAIQKTGAVNLSAPESWIIYRTTNGLSSDSVTKIVSFNNSVIAATSKGLSSFDGSSWTDFTDQFDNVLVNDILVAGDSLFIVSGLRNISKYHNELLTPVYSSVEENIFELNYSSAQGILAATSKGIYRVSDGSYIYPNGPFANLFPDLAVDNNGILWSASNTNPGGGFYKYNGIEWSNFNVSTTPELSTNTYYNIYIDSDNTVYLASWGQGFTIIKNGNILNFSVGNTGMQGIGADPNFLVIGGFAKDSRNNIWVLNHGSIDRKNLTKSSNLEQWDSYPVSAIDRYVDESYHLVVDQYNTKWFAVQRHKQGLFYFNEGSNSDPLVISDDVSGYLNKSTGLNHDFVSSIAVDRRGDLWVGTSLGVNIISNVRSVLSGNPQLLINSVFSLRQQTITAVLVDPLNQKWIGTKQGLHLVNSDGTSLLATFNTKNSPLLSDEITSLTIDENSGTIYAGTDNRGITAFKTTSVKPKESFDELFAFPNPYILNNQNNLITIDGLIRDTDIKILTINGKLVKQFTTPGGRIALWDGRDELGDLVPSGVYFIVAFDQEGNNVTKTKIAVLREE